MVKIVADNAITWLDKLFAKHGEISRYSGREIDFELLKDVELLLTRSTVKVDTALLENTMVKLVASATAGRDHINQNNLEELGIEFAHAPGCNANAVAEYVVAALAWHQKQGMLGLDRNLTAAVIGCGRIGSKVKQKLENLGFEVIVNDPPLAQTGGQDYNFVCLPEALQADVICMHTPLTTAGDYPSYHLLDEHELKQINPDAVLINAGRGEVINNQALVQILDFYPDLKVVLDVWENEPNIDWTLFNKVNLGTPHIAGHSWRGKVMSAVMIYQQACEFFDWQPQSIDESDLKIELPPFKLTNSVPLYGVIERCYDIEADYKNLQSMIKGKNDQQAAVQFDCFRKNYYRRPEFKDLDYYGDHSLYQKIIQSLGFNLQ